MKKFRNLSLQMKLTAAFTALMVVIIATAGLFNSILVNRIREFAYEKMQAQSEFYRETFERQIDLTLAQQQEIYANRKLPFAMRSDSGLSVYEERDAILSIREWMRTVTDLTEVADRGELFLPGSGYYLSNSTVRRLTAEDSLRLEAYLARGVDGIGYDGTDFYSIVTNVASGSARHADYALVITFSTREICEDLSLFGTVVNGGAFVYNDENDVMLCSTGDEELTRTLWDRLKWENGQIIRTQSVRAGGDTYLVLMSGNCTLGAFGLYLDEHSAVSYIWKYCLFVPLFILLATGLALGFMVYTKHRLYMPLNVLIGAFEKVKGGDLSERIHHNMNDEFSFIYEEFNDMEERIQHLIEEVYVRENLAQQAKIKQLQAQINPHFLYNSYFTLCRRIKRGDYENAEKFAGYLGDYFKYITRDGSDTALLREEVEHARSYAAIQASRFQSRIAVEFAELPEKYAGVMLPRLVLQPLLENSFGHSLENKVSGGILRVSFTENGEALRVTVEDNGEGVGDDVIESMRAKLNDPNPDQVTGTVNIHRRLRIFFHGSGGLEISRSELGGVAISIVIQGWEKEDGNEPESADRG